MAPNPPKTKSKRPLLPGSGKPDAPKTNRAYGKVIDGANRPVVGLKVRLFVLQPRTKKSTPIAEAETDSDGRFSITYEIEKSRFVLSKLGGIPAVFLELHDRRDHRLVETRAVAAEPEIEYRMRLEDRPAYPKAPNLYANGMKRMMGGMRKGGASSPLGEMKAGATDEDANFEKRARQRVDEILKNAKAASDRLNHLFAGVEGMGTAAAEQLPVQAVGYDGPQAPKNPWSVPDVQTIVWPRKDRFPWE